VKFTIAPVPVIEPRVALVTAHTYETVPGQDGVHAGVAVNICLLPELTVGAVGLKATEFSVGTMTVIMVEAPFVAELSVALT
jgi:hypothetical protein